MCTVRFCMRSAITEVQQKYSRKQLHYFVSLTIRRPWQSLCRITSYNVCYTKLLRKKSKLKDKKYSYLFDTPKMGEYVCLDCETTGLNPKKDEILSIGAVLIKDNKVLMRNTFKPEAPRREALPLNWRTDRPRISRWHPPRSLHWRTAREWS